MYSLSAWSFEYQLDSSSLLNTSTLQRYELQRYFQKAGYETLSDTNLSAVGLPFDSLLVANHWDKSIMLKAGLKVPGNIEGRIIEDTASGVLAFHFRFQDTPYLLVSTGLSKADLQTLVRPWLVSSQTVLWKIFVSSAEAAYCPPNAGSANRNTDSLKSTADHIEKNEVLKAIGRCGMDALNGANQSATQTLTFFKNLATNPAKLWTEMKESFVQLKEFALNIDTELQQVYAAFGAMSGEQKLQLACSMSGELIAGAAQSFIVGGALAKLLPQLILKMKSASAMFIKIANLEKLGLKMPDKSLLTREILSCAR